MRMKKSTSKGGLKTESNNNNNNNIRRKIEWELRPGGMLVQKRDDGEVSSGPVIKIKVSHGSYHHEISVPAQSTFGDLKRVLASETGLEPKEQRLLFQGKEKDDDEWLHMVGVMDMSKVMLFEDPASKERKLEEMKRNQGILNAYESVARVRAEVDKLSEKVVAMETIVHGGKKVADKEFVVLTELLMRQLLNLDAIEADGEARVHRRIEVRRVQSFVETLDKMKARNSNPFGNASNSVSVTTKWETFETRFGSPSAAVPQVPGTKITQDWELFDSPSFHPIDGPVNIQKGSI